MSKYKKILLVSALMMSANYALAISKGRATRLVNESGVGVYLNAAQKAKIAEELSASNIPNTRGDNLSKAIDFINSHSIVTAKKAAAASGAGAAAAGAPTTTPRSRRGASAAAASGTAAQAGRTATSRRRGSMGSSPSSAGASGNMVIPPYKGRSAASGAGAPSAAAGAPTTTPRIRGKRGGASAAAASGAGASGNMLIPPYKGRSAAAAGAPTTPPRSGRGAGAAAASGAGLTPPATPPGKRGRAGEHTPVILGAPGGSPQKQVRSATGTTERASRTAENADSANLASRLELQISNSDDSSYSDDFESDDRS